MSESDPISLGAPPPGAEGSASSLDVTQAGLQRPRPGMWQPPDPVDLQQQIPQYKVLELLGRGGMGAVYKGWQVSLDRYVAIKILPPDIEDGEAHFADRFKREAKTMARLQHPGIVAVIDTGETTKGLLYFVMEFIEGTDVAQMLKSQGRLSPDHALAITAHVCDALHYAHTHGVVHRDIKPANIMVNLEGMVKVADFGLAKSVGAGQMGLTRTDMSMGTPDFIAPEALMPGVVADHRADLYAVGVMLYNMLTGEIPRGHFKLPSTKASTDARFDAVVLKAMEQEREHRYQNAQEIRRDLDVILTTPVEKAPPPDDPPPTLPLKKSGAPPAAAASSESPPQRGAKASKTGVSPAPPGRKKSSAGLIAGAVGAMVVLGVGGFFAFKKPAGDGKEDAPGSGDVRSAASQPVAGASSNAIQLFDTPDKVPKLPGMSWENGTVHLEDTGLISTESRARDAVLRATVRMNPDAGNGPNLWLRKSETKNNTAYEVSVSARTGKIFLHLLTGEVKNRLGEWPLPRAYGPDEWMKLEFRAVGDALTVSADGTVLGTVHDGTLHDAGIVMLYAFEKGYFRDIEFVSLDDARKTNAPIAPAPATGAPPLPAPSSGLAADWPSATAWKPLFPDAEWHKDVPGQREFTDGLLHLQHFHLEKPQTSPDGAIRALIQIRANSLGPSVVARGSAEEGSYLLALRYDGKEIALTFHPPGSGAGKELGKFSLPEPVQPGDKLMLELRAQGDHLQAFVNGASAIDAHDARCKSAGKWGIKAEDAWFKSAEVLSSLSTSVSDSSRFPPGKWVKLFTKFEDLPPELRQPDSGVTMEDGWLRFGLNSKNSLNLPLTLQNNYAVRARFLRNGDSYQTGSIVMRVGKDEEGQNSFYSLDISPKPDFECRRKNGEQYPALFRERIQPSDGDPRDELLEFGVVGERLVGRMGQSFVRMATDSHLKTGRAYVANGNRTAMRDIEVMNLDGLPEAEALRLLGVDEQGQDIRGKGQDATVEQWVDALQDRSKLAFDRVDVTPAGAELHGSSSLKFKQGPQRDGAVRMRTTFGSTTGELSLRARDVDSTFYGLMVTADGKLLLRRFDHAKHNAFNLGQAPLPATLQAGQEYEIELRVIGPKITAKFNGEVLVEAEDAHILEGYWGVSLAGQAATPAFVKSIEYLDFDAPAPAATQIPPGK